MIRPCFFCLWIGASPNNIILFHQLTNIRIFGSLIIIAAASGFPTSTSINIILPLKMDAHWHKCSPYTPLESKINRNLSRTLLKSFNYSSIPLPLLKHNCLLNPQDSKQWGLHTLRNNINFCPKNKIFWKSFWQVRWIASVNFQQKNSYRKK